MTIRGFLRGLRIYVRDWRLPPHIVFGLMFGVFGLACGARFYQSFIVGVLLSGCWEYAVGKGWIRSGGAASSPE